MGLRVHIGKVDAPLASGAELLLPEGAARHVQVMRMQPGEELNIFDGSGQEWVARIVRMGKRDVAVQVTEVAHVDKELADHVTLAVGVPANDRMDTVVEKAAELGVRTIQPLMCERSVLRLAGERAAKKVAHWQAVAISACEQCGRTVVPEVLPVQSIESWLANQGRETLPQQKAVLSLRNARWVGDWLKDAAAPTQATGLSGSWVFLSGPEGGLSPQEEEAARLAGFQAISLGTRTLRADTAPITVMAILSTRQPPTGQMSA